MATAELGFTLSHEHVLLSAAGIQQIYPEFLDRQGIIDDAVAALQAAYAEGVRTIVDMTTMDLGRDVRATEEVSRRSGVHIIATTGSHQFIPRVFWTAPPDDIASLYVREVEEGIEGTDIKASVIKAASDRGGVTEREANILRAAARAHKRSGAPMTTHTWSPDRVGEQQIRILDEEGVDLSRVYIGHSNDDTDVDYLVGMLKQGVWLGLDRFPGGRPPYGAPNWEQRTEIVVRLIEAGYVDRIMLSHDYMVPLNHPADVREDRRQLNPDGYCFITRYVLPRLKKLGISDEHIRTMMVDNPRRYFEGA